MAATPKRLRINGNSYRVSFLPEEALPDALGQHHADSATIEVRKGLTPFIEKDTLLHEVFHAIRSAQGFEYGEAVEEGYVRSLATGLVGVLQDNPSFAKWLIESIPKNTP